jgi:palmitoyltransferase ZDHHC13/17
MRSLRGQARPVSFPNAQNICFKPNPLSHCPWVDNCVAINNHRHFVLYVLCMAAGIIFFDWLAIKLLETLPRPESVSCNVINAELCQILNSDPFTISLTLWTTLQLIWVTMLVMVQLVQIARGLTTYEAMTQHHKHPHGPADAFTSFVTSGTTSMDQAGLTPGQRGPDPAVQPNRPHQKNGCLDQWKRMLGIDTFLATAMFGSNAATTQSNQRSNPFSRGLLQNCKDFWLDSAPVFGSRQNGEAMLGGLKVDYTNMYYVPARTTTRGGQDSGGAYESLATTDDAV